MSYFPHFVGKITLGSDQRGYVSRQGAQRPALSPVGCGAREPAGTEVAGGSKVSGAGSLWRTERGGSEAGDPDNARGRLRGPFSRRQS